MSEKHCFFLTVMMLFVFSAHAQAQHSIDVGLDETIVNSTLILDCDEKGENCPVNSWSLEWRVPEDATILNVSDSGGEIKNYQRTGNNIIQIQTNEGPRRTQEKLRIEYIQKQKSENVAENLRQKEIKLNGFPNTSTTGKITVKNFLSAKLSPNFETSYKNNSILFKGQGPTNIRINFGKGYKSKYYAFFGDERNATLPYRVAVGTTGLTQSYETIPVVLLDQQDYDRQVSGWSQGEYSSGLIKVRKSLTDSFEPVLAEETVHAFNDEALSFDQTSSAWLDEGLGSYTQSMVRKKLIGEAEMRSIFGNETQYTIEENGSTYRVTKPSTGDRENLWQYYRENSSFMKKWNARDGDADTRSFGYAYSELIIRNHVSKNNSIEQLYTDIDRDEPITSNDEKWRYIGKYIDLTPCKFEDRRLFDQCLDRINKYDYPVYSASEIPEKDTEDLRIEELETPNYTKPESGSFTSKLQNAEILNKNWASTLNEFLQKLIQSLTQFSF